MHNALTKNPIPQFLYFMTTFSIEGCCHGDLDRIYEVLENIEVAQSLKAEFLICCGDFQAIRTKYVLEIPQFLMA